MFDEILNIPPYALEKKEKNNLLLKRLQELTDFHRKNCVEYRNILKAWDAPQTFEDKNGLPFLPVRLFKELDLKSVKEEEIFKTMTSSGTTGQAVSKIYLNRATSVNQQKALVKLSRPLRERGACLCW